MTEESLERKRAKRRAHRGVVTKYVQEVNTFPEVLDSPTRRRAEVLRGLLTTKQEVLSRLDEEILEACATEDIEGEIIEADEILVKIKETLIDINRTTGEAPEREETPITRSTSQKSSAHVSEDDSESDHEADPPLRTSGKSKVRPKLPKLVLPKFSGDVTKFRSFWDSYKSAIDENSDLSIIDKFNYLRSLLEGPAAKSIQGLPLTESNYNSAKQILEGRFGRTQQVISAHMDDLLKIQACSGDKISHLRAVYDKIHINVRGLESLGVTADQYGSFLIPVIMSKLPAEVRLQVARVTAKEIWEVQEILTVIKAEVEAREISDTIKINEKKTDGYITRRMAPPSATALTVQARQGGGGVRCVFCKEGHYSASCTRLQDVQSRKELLRRERRCFSCLSVGHKVGQCTSSRRCRNCNRRHHQSICDAQDNTPPPILPTVNNGPPQIPPTTNNAPPQIPLTVARDNSSQGTQNIETTRTNATRSRVDILLQTAKAWACNVDGQTVPVRVMLDGGSQRSYITNDLKTRLRLNPVRVETMHLNIFGTDSYERKRCDLVEVTLKGHQGESVHLQVAGFPKICSPLSTKVDVCTLTELQGFELADQDPSSDGGKIDILIGSDYYWEVVTGEIVRDASGLVAMNSKFGWILSGPMRVGRGSQGFITASLVLQGSEVADPCRNQGDTNLNEELRRFWEIDAIGITEHPEPESQFLHSLRFDATQGRYEVCLPWKIDCKPPSTNYNICLFRLQHLQSRLKMNRVLAQEYADTFNRQAESGIIERVPSQQERVPDVFFLPHHGVVRVDKETTKLRIVFDGSARDTNSCSLNDCLEKGPNLTPRVFDVLVKFRAYLTGLTADIEKAFHQIAIDPRDRDMLRFLWFDNVQGDHPSVIQYRFCRLVFGLNSSPAILNSVLRHHLTQGEGHRYINSLLAESLYVDDFVGGAANDDEAFEIYHKARHIMRVAGFNLRKWNTNSPMLKTKIDNELKGAYNYEDAQSATELKILGLGWSTESDELFVDMADIVKYVHSLIPTKRSLLKFSAKLFDPLGFLGPFTVRQKMLFQSLCCDKVNWDEQLEGEALQGWNRLPADLEAISRVRVPRCYFRKTQEVASCQLHGFCDASQKAFAAAIYIRVEYEGGEPEVTLVTSKTRVAPIKKQSIPRLELLGATILARLMNTVKHSLDKTKLPCELNMYYWTDSYTTLCWIRNNHQWKQYVQHRVSEIHNLTDREQWRFCPGTVNPADLPSRGCSGEELVSNNNWWRGPEFLCQPQSSWPILPASLSTNEAEKELIKHPPALIHALTTNEANLLTVNLEGIIDITRYSSKIKLLRVTATVIKIAQFWMNENRAVQTWIPLEAVDLNKAEERWIQTIQQNRFSEELKILKSGRPSSNRVINQLNLGLDDKGLIRCHGRINNAAIPEGSKTPLLLPTRHRFTELLIQSIHCQVFHNGIRETLNALRENYWIIRGREMVKQVLRRCVVCKKHQGPNLTIAGSAELPPERVANVPPFTNTAVDFAGPLYVKNSEHINKTYVCLFTCATTRAIHLELTTSLGAPQFLQAFRRFVGRRGLPARMLSDNAKTFKAAAKEVKKLVHAEEVLQYCTNRQVSWEYIVERAPWWGGFWERMVRSVKVCLRKHLGRSSLTFEELRTILIEIEAVLNNRPLTYVYDDENGVSYPLTPSQLVYGRQLTMTVDGRQTEIVSTYQSLTKKAQHHNRLLNRFALQWGKEYLLGLRERYQTSSAQGCNQTALNNGDVVLLKNEGTARCLWKLAKVVELLQGRDGAVRAAKVQVLNTDKRIVLLRRPIQHLVPLEVNKPGYIMQSVRNQGN